MPDAYRVTPQPMVGQHGPAWIRWVDHYAHAHASAVETIAVQDFPPMVVDRIEEEEEEEEAEEATTSSNVQIVLTLMARLGYAHGLRTVPITLEDVVAMTEALVLEKVLGTLRASAIIGDYYADEPSMGRASPLGAALKRWLEAVLRSPAAQPRADR